MLRKTSVVIISTGARELITTSPVTMPTFSAPSSLLNSLNFWLDRAFMGAV